MTTSLSLPFTVHRSPFTMCYLLTVTSGLWLIVTGKYMVNREWLTVNCTGGACAGF